MNRLRANNFVHLRSAPTVEALQEKIRGPIRPVRQAKGRGYPGAGRQDGGDPAGQGGGREKGEMQKDGLKPFKALQGLLPPLARDDYERLRADIAERGSIQVPILVGPEGIIDGAHRYQIAQEMGLDIPLKESEARGKEAIKLGLALNLARRHLSFEQKRELIGRLRGQRWTQEEVARVVGMYQSSVSMAESTSNIKTDNACAPPDVRVKLAKEDQREVVKRVKAGESQEQVAADYSVSQQRVSQIVAQAKKEEERKTNVAVLPEGKFAVLYADPPWQYEFSKVEAWGVSAHYDTLSTEDIANYRDDRGTPIQDAILDEAVLFLWAPQPKLKDALQVIEAWGFEYVTGAIWVKDRLGMGYWWMQKHELLLLGKRGNFPAPATGDRPASVFEAPWRGHSKKPAILYEMLERMCPLPAASSGPYYLECFARENGRPHWAAFGKEYSSNG